jgi:CxxC motif-containing protein (DUF1111 family)
MRRDAKWFVGVRVWIGAVVAVAVSCDVAPAADRKGRTVSRESIEGRDLFQKVWTHDASKPAGGDGLGPLYNADSCVACHHQGGPGGGGPNEVNVVLLTTGGRPGVDCGAKVFQGEPDDLHPGLRNRTSVVLHRHATDGPDKTRLDAIGGYVAIQTRDELMALKHSQRNTPALFGVGWIDGIPEAAIREAASRRSSSFPEIKGRASVLKDGRIGRFGWKGQTASLREFVVAACANELGLEVPGQHQASLASAKEFDPSKLGLDLEAKDVGLLDAYVRDLPRPTIRPIDPIAPYRGRAVFEAIGCATCHAPRLGNVDGLYSDLLLHDLGDRLLDVSGGYGAPVRRQVVDASPGDASSRPTSGDAGPTEWRTPPLWGVGHSAPYLHDGRARTLDEAIRLHGGEADATSKRYAALDAVDRQAVVAFLRSLVAPARPGQRRPAPAPAELPRMQGGSGGMGFTGLF